MSKNKRMIFFAMAVICAIVLWTRYSGQSVPVQVSPVFRFHVLANSDSPQDQEIKLKVRDAVLGVYGKRLARTENVQDAMETARQAVAEIANFVTVELAQQGVTYGAKAKVLWEEFPDKTYGDKVYPAGQYPALQIELGEGKGKNWWCVLFPPLCFIDVAVQDAGSPTATIEPTTQTATAKPTITVAPEQTAEPVPTPNVTARPAPTVTLKPTATPIKTVTASPKVVVTASPTPDGIPTTLDGVVLKSKVVEAIEAIGSFISSLFGS